ncbi:ABC transporter permease [Virgisporangium aurantiacum]|uniref:ABC transporter permease n=1 Tax=Virgisporangium aurantiacum TaxID=175570 RepID=A0A8J3Z783_9ACTN|nr:ABC-2 family transporter protein [Virgisporangium aurantiacum]GIJ58292.1 ABC transporter permease [Virgisporangium aurantiacum]
MFGGGVGNAVRAEAVLFATLVAMGFRRWSTYRLAALAGAFSNTVFGLVRANVTIAVVGVAGGTVAGYDAVGVATYVWVGQALLGSVYIFQWTDLAMRIRTGDIAVDLGRPVDPQFAYLAGDLGRAAFDLIPRGAPPLIIGALVTGVALPASPLPYLLGVVSLVLAVVISFAGRWLVNLAGFWLMDLRGPMATYLVAVSVLNGLIVPVHWFPDWLKTLAACTPFPSMLQAPIDVVTGRVQGLDALSVMAVQVGWAGALLGLGQVVYRRGARRLVVQGG